MNDKKKKYIIQKTKEVKKFLHNEGTDICIISKIFKYYTYVCTLK